MQYLKQNEVKNIIIVTIVFYSQLKKYTYICLLKKYNNIYSERVDNNC